MLERFNRAKESLLKNEYKYLNPEQQEAVFAPQNGTPLILCAGAGTGKTTTIVNKIAYLIKYGDAFSPFEALPSGVTEEIVAKMENAAISGQGANGFKNIIAKNPLPSYSVLAVTFTNKAANEMKERINDMTGPYAEDMWIGTFHSICVKILHRFIDRLDGFNSNFTIYDTDDAKSLLKNCVKQLDINEKEFTPSYLLNIISDNKNKMISPEEYEQMAGKNFKAAKVAQVYSLYQQKLKSNNALDFDDIINHTVHLLEANPDVASKLANRFKVVIIDEFQDTNDAQYKFVDIISKGCSTLCAVGDDDQSIYGWRGANIEHIMDLRKNGRGLTINRNYRSYSSIIDVANSVIKNNKYRFDKQLRAERKGGEKVTYNCTASDLEEGAFVADTIRSLARETGREYSDFTVLYRTNAQSRIFEESFLKRGIPYKIVGSLRFYERQEIKDMLAYLRIIVNPDDSISLRRVINMPKRGIGGTTVEQLENLSSLTGRNVMDIIENCDDFESLKRARTGLKSFGEAIKNIISYSSENPVSDLIKHISEYVDLEKEYLKDGEDVCASRMENIAELVNIAAELEEAAGDEPYTLSDFLERMALISGIDEMEDDAGVTLMTVHTSKGLEFPVVFVVGLEETLFPSIRGYGEDEKEIEEERRLCYVAITRAKDKLYLTCSKRRMTYGKTSYNPVSRFIKEIPVNLLDDISPEEPETFFDPEISRYERMSGVSFSDFASKYTPPRPVNKTEIKSFVQKESKPGQSFSAGDRVTHKKFGDGTVFAQNASGDMIVLTVDFDTCGRKNIISSVVTRI